MQLINTTWPQFTKIRELISTTWPQFPKTTSMTKAREQICTTYNI